LSSEYRILDEKGREKEKGRVRGKRRGIGENWEGRER